MIMPSEYLGLFDWLLLCDKYEVRVKMWFGDESFDIVSGLSAELFQGRDSDAWPVYNVRGAGS